MIIFSMFDLLIIDACYVMRRYFHAYAVHANPDKRENGAVYGLCKLLCWILYYYPNAGCAVVFDTGKPSFRKNIFLEYKAHRDKTPEDFINQIKIAREISSIFNASIFLGENGYEADDIIASIAKQLKYNYNKIGILSFDKDMMQLVDEKIVVIDPIKKDIIDYDGVVGKYNVTPEQMCDYQALVGDAADNIPGVKGIGAKTASNLLNEYYNLEKIYNNLNNIKEKTRTKLLEQKDKLELSRKLVELEKNANIDKNIKTMLISNQAIDFIKSLDFKTLTKFLIDEINSNKKIAKNVF